MSDYLSDRENGPRARPEQTFSPQVWGGLVPLVQSLINSSASPPFSQSCNRRSHLLSTRIEDQQSQMKDSP